MTIERFPSSDVMAGRAAQQEVLRRLDQWDGVITPEAARAGQRAQDEQERANASPIPVVFPVDL